MKLALKPSPLPMLSSRTLLTLAVYLLIFLVSFGAVAYRLDNAPDIFTDEIIYTRMSLRVAGEGALVWDSGQPFVVHPPLYFLLQGIYSRLTSDASTLAQAVNNAGDVFAAVAKARMFNALFAGLTGVILFWFGWRAHSPTLALVLLALYALDPFGVRINRRAMLETLAGFLSLAGIFIFWLAMGKAKRTFARAPGVRLPLEATGEVIGAGLMLGAALLTKELTFTALLAVLLFSAWETIIFTPVRALPNGAPGRLSNWRLMLPGLATVAIAWLTYMIYPNWMTLNGDLASLSREKILGVQRVLGLVQLSGWNRPGVSLLDYLLERLVDYGSSYAILALGGVALVCLWLWGRQMSSARLMIAWGVVLYPFYFFLALVGSGNDQFFYYLLLPAMLLVAYATVTATKLPALMVHSRLRRYDGFLSLAYLASVITRFAVVGLLIMVLPFNMLRWWSLFGRGSDNGYQQLSNYIRENIPPGEAINASGDPIKYHYFLPDYQVFAAGTPEQAMKQSIHLFALAPKDVQFHYGKITPHLAEWVQANGTQLFHYQSHTYGDLFLYHVPYPSARQGLALSTLTSGGAHWRSFQPATSAFTGLLWVLLALWGIAWGGLYLLLRAFIQQQTNSTELVSKEAP